MSIKETDTPLLYSCCIPVRGAQRSIVCDLQRNSYVFIPNLIFEVLETYRGMGLNKLRRKFAQNLETLEKYFTLLEKAEYLFFTDSPEKFPKINIAAWDEPALI